MEYTLLASLKLHFAELSQQRRPCQPCQMFTYPSGASAENLSQSQVQQSFKTEATRQQPDQKPSFQKRRECRTSAAAMAAMLPAFSRKHAGLHRLQQQKRSFKSKTRDSASRIRPHHLPPCPLPGLGHAGSYMQQPADMHICQETTSTNPMNSLVHQSHMQRIASIANSQQALSTEQCSHDQVGQLLVCIHRRHQGINCKQQYCWLHTSRPQALMAGQAKTHSQHMRSHQSWTWQSPRQTNIKCLSDCFRPEQKWTAASPKPACCCHSKHAPHAPLFSAPLCNSKHGCLHNRFGCTLT